MATAQGFMSAVPPLSAEWSGSPDLLRASPGLPHRHYAYSPTYRGGFRGGILISPALSVVAFEPRPHLLRQLLETRGVDKQKRDARDLIDGGLDAGDRRIG